MLDSMERNPIPTRAEVTDVYNAITDGADAVMLSGETSKGPYPIQAIKVMCGIAEQAEHDMLEDPKGRFPKAEDRFLNLLREAEKDLPGAQARVRKKIKGYEAAEGDEARYYGEEYSDIARLLETQKTTDRVSHAACSLSVGTNATAIMAPSTSGQTTRMVARFRPVAPIIGAAHDYCVARKLTLCFGVHPINILRTQQSNEDVFKAGCDKAKSIIRREPAREGRGQPGRPLVKRGDQIVITAGFPLYRRGTTNLVKLHTVDDDDS
jgi:pyruvate kinase